MNEKESIISGFPNLYWMKKTYRKRIFLKSKTIFSVSFLLSEEPFVTKSLFCRVEFTADVGSN